MNEPLSEKIGEYDGGNFWVTAASWQSYEGGKSYEIGVRCKANCSFTLLQSEKYNHQSVQEVANVIAMLLADKTQSYDPYWCKEYLT